MGDRTLLAPLARFALCALALSCLPLVAQPAAPALDELQVFVREGCPHCADAKEFLPGFAAAHPGLRITYRSLDHDPTARDELVRRSRAAGLWPPGVPTFAFGDELLAGFESPEATGPRLEALVARAARPVPEVETPWLGTLSVSRLGLPLFTLAIGLVDGLNPCAMWVLLFLLSMLVHLQDRRRMALIAGTFVFVSGAVYYAFMAAWLNLFLAVGLSTAVRLGLGAAALLIGVLNVRDAMAGSYTLAIPAAAKPGIYARVRALLQARTLALALGAAAVLAVAVNFIELLCTAGLPAIYTAVLAQQGLSPPAHYAYLGLYIVGYIADDALMVAIAVTALGSRKLTERGGQWLKLLSGAVMLALGVVMIARPQWLA